jgi:hypothetical protein
MLFSLVFLLLALDTQQIPQPLPLAWPLAPPARRRRSGEGDAAFRGEHRQQRRLVRTDLLAERIGQDVLRVVHPERVTLPGELTAGRGQRQEQGKGGHQNSSTLSGEATGTAV